MRFDKFTIKSQELIAGAQSLAGQRQNQQLEPSHLDPGEPGRMGVMDEMLSSEDPLMAMEACILEELLKRSNWKMQDVADRLGISRVTLWRKLREHGIVKES